MKLIDTTKKRRKLFELLATTRGSAQAAMMTLQPGQDTGEPENEHPQSEQWLFVISGTGRANVGKRTAKLSAGSLLLIEKREIHQVKNTGRRPLVTINLYVPPAYSKNGEPL